MKIITRTIYGSNLQSALILGVPHRFVANTTLNEKLEILAGIYPPPDINPALRYLAIGNRGHRALAGTDGFMITDTVNHRASDAAAFNHIPFVLREINNDLTPTQRERYGLRKIEVIKGRNYIAYYLKRLDLTGIRPEMQHTRVVDSVSTTVPFVPSAANLSPVPPALPNDGIITTNGDYLSTTASIPINFDAVDVQELIDAAKIIYGDERYAVISELAMCSGVDKMTDGPGVGGSQISYKEVIGVQVCTLITAHYPLGFSNQGFNFRVELGATEPLIGESVIGTSP